MRGARDLLNKSDDLRDAILEAELLDSVRLVRTFKGSLALEVHAELEIRPPFAIFRVKPI